MGLMESERVGSVWDTPISFSFGCWCSGSGVVQGWGVLL